MTTPIPTARLVYLARVRRAVTVVPLVHRTTISQLIPKNAKNVLTESFQHQALLGFLLALIHQFAEKATMRKQWKVVKRECEESLTSGLRAEGQQSAKREMWLSLTMARESQKAVLPANLAVSSQ